jgi:hypothetical protein
MALYDRNHKSNSVHNALFGAFCVIPRPTVVYMLDRIYTDVMDTDLHDKLTPGRFSTNIHQCAGCGVEIYRNVRRVCRGQFRCITCKLKMAREYEAKHRKAKQQAKKLD